MRDGQYRLHAINLGRFSGNGRGFRRKHDNRNIALAEIVRATNALVGGRI